LQQRSINEVLLKNLSFGELMENIIRSEMISTEGAARFIQNDMMGLHDCHKGFLSPADYPFTKPLHYPIGIIMWPPVDIHPAAKIGNGVIIGRYTNICGNITIGENTRIQGFCFIPDCVEIGMRVFIGPGVIFTNVKYPSARHDRDRVRDGKIIVEDFASIGAGAVICPGVRIGFGALIGAGAIVTKDVLPETVVVGCPARPLK